ncbi:40S ribosomal protein S5-1 [Hordeum vulgare]|nr:40S ribosomal protein S5-1 [Hordeum vulgare]
MTSPSSSKDTFFEKVINPYLLEVMKHPQAIEMREGELHIRDVQGPKKEGCGKARLAVVVLDIIKCQGMVEHGMSANHSMITDFIREIFWTPRTQRDSLRSFKSDRSPPRSNLRTPRSKLSV